MSQAFLITGATGKQGGALVRSLISQPGFSPTTHSIYALTRDVNSGSAKKLASLSPAIKPIQGNISQPAGIFTQLDPKPVGVFIVHPLVNGDEVKDCKAVIDLAVEHNAKHIVYSSVDRASEDDPTYVPHFATKHAIEMYLKDNAAASNGSLTYTIFRPVFFMDNLVPGFFAKLIATAWRDALGPDRKLQVIDTKDIGEFAALALMNPQDKKYKNKGLNLAGDELSFAEADDLWRKKTGEKLPTTYSLFPKTMFALVKDMGLMFKWFKDVGYNADIEALNELKPMVTFEEWIDQNIVSK